MVTQRMGLVGPLVLCALLAPPADAQDEGGFEGKPTDFLPLQVGNQWTYTHNYLNFIYGQYEIASGDPFDVKYLEYFDPLELLAERLTMEIPGYPFYPPIVDLLRPPDDLDSPGRRELTIEITHTETIEGHEYFVFSDPPYDWPPVPTLCLAGQKVRFSDEGVLLVRQPEQDIPLYDFTPPYGYGFGQVDKEYATPAYPVLYDAHDPIRLSLKVFRSSWDARDARVLRLSWDRFYPPPLSFGPAFVAGFYTSPFFGLVYFLANYGLARYETWITGIFGNDIKPVSAVIDGKKIDYPYDPPFSTNVQPTSWGQLKARHRQRP